MADSILVSWHPPKDQSIKVRKYKLGWGKGYPDVEIQVLDGKQRSYAIKPIGIKHYEKLFHFFIKVVFHFFIKSLILISPFSSFVEPTTEYVISLRATNNVGDGQPAYANVRTPERFVSESAVPLIPPVGLKAIVLSATTVVLYWTDTTLSKSQVRLRHTHIYIIALLFYKTL